MSTRATGEDSHPGSDNVALTRSPGFWVIVRYAIVFGVVLAFVGLAFLGLVKGGTDLWFTLPEDPGWFDGSLWWVAVTAGAGLLVGVLRRVFRVPARLPGTVQELKDAAGRALHGAGGGCRLAGVAGRWGEPRARGRTGEDGGRAGNLGLGAAEARARTCARRTRSVGCPRRTGACCHLRSWRRSSRSRSRVQRRHASPTRWSRVCWRPRSRSRCTFRSRGRRSSGSTRCRRTSTRTGSCSRPFPSASSPARSR